MTTAADTATALEQLSKIAVAWGSDPALIQGPGGNFSVKVGEALWVKSSGVILKKTTPSSGWTEVAWRPFLSAMPTGPGDATPSPEAESHYTRAVGEARSNPAHARPSMELGFHAAVAHTWVLHTHSLAGVLVGLLPPTHAGLTPSLAPVRDRGFVVVRIPPAIPGLQLTWAFLAEVAKQRAALERAKGALWLLENHGVVWTSSDLEATLHTARAFEAAAAARFEMKQHPLPPWQDGPEGEPFLDFSGWPAFSYAEACLFPDYAVFFPGAAPSARGRRVFPPREALSKDRDTVAELIYAHALVSTLGERHGCLRALPAAMAKEIAQLEIEKLRLKQARESK